ncbi:MAG: ABC transporter ATP-binding protein [Flavipsychrobacter sp.]
MTEDITHIIEAKGLSKSFGSFQAVDDLSFSVEKGDVYGFLGQNGAGKSTTIRMITGLIKPSSGEVYINGQRFSNNNRSLLKHVGAIIERPDMYGFLSGLDNLKMFAKMSKVPIARSRIGEVLEIVGLSGRENDKVKAYSQGMKQRLGIAIALIHNPDLLILDEPTNGLDPQGIAEMRNLIVSLSKEHGKTILISSHLLYEIEQVANRMLIIHKGQKVVEGAVKELLNPNDTLMEIKMLPDDEVVNKLEKTQWGEYIKEMNSSSIVLKMHPRKMPALNKMLVAEGVHVLEIRSKHSLEAYFLSLTSNADAPVGII